MTSPITNTVSTFIESQLPGFIRDDNPQFAAFLKAYYAWMEQSNAAAVIAQSKQLLSYKDIDRTLDGFLQYYVNDFLPYFPNDIALDKRKLIKLAREFYLKKGSIESIQFLFRVLYNLEADIFFPKEHVLKASDGKWKLPQALRLIEQLTPFPTVDGGNTFSAIQTDDVDAGDFSDVATLLLEAPSFDSGGFNNLDKEFDVTQLIGRKGIGTVSNSVCVIESADRVIDLGIGLEIVEVYITGITKPFSDLENLSINYGTDANGAPLIYSQKIVASLSNILINPKSRGLKYRGLSKDGSGSIIYPGDPVVITGGLPVGDTQAQKAVAYVNSATTGSITAVNPDFGGYGYRVAPNTIVTVVNDPSDTTGTGANVIVNGIDQPNSIFVLINRDVISYKGNVRLDSANYGFANQDMCNSNTTLALGLAFDNIQFGAITSLNVINGGGGYTAPPTFSETVIYYSDLDDDLANVSDPALANNLNYMADLGYVCAVAVGTGGNGYSNVTDTIVVPSAIGYNAVFDFITSPGTNAITSVIITNRGEGYIELPIILSVANSANVANASAGQGAQLTAYGFGQGAQLNASVNKIGQIIDFRMPSRGFDYVSTPNVSLRIQDIILNDPGSNLTFSVDEAIFQGSNVNNTTYIANVDSYNVASKTVRVYNYRGALVPSLNLSTVTQNVSINLSTRGNVVTYGDGKAKANAIFLNGLIQFKGFFYNTDGFLSSDMYLQDSNTYHNYSYIINVEKSLRDYKDTIMQLVHPVGMSMLGKFIVNQEKPEHMNVTSKVAMEPAIHGRVYCSAFDINKVLLGSGAGNTTTNSYAAIANNNQTVFDITPNPDNTDFVANDSYALVMRNGVIKIPVLHYDISGNVITLVQPCVLDDIVEARIFGDSGNNLTIGSDYFFAGVNQSSFALTTSATPPISEAYIVVSKNGLIQCPNLDYTMTYSTVGLPFITPHVNFSTNCRFGDYVEARSFTGNLGVTGNVIITSQYSNVTINGQQTFILSQNVDSVESVIAMKNGLVQIPTMQYLIIANNILVFNGGCRLNDLVEFRMFTGDVGAGEGTNFLQTTSPGDLVTFGYQDGTRPLFTKVVTRVVSNNMLNMESNTQFPFDGLISVTSGDSIITTNSGIIGNIASQDIVQMNIAGNVISSMVLSPISDTTLTVNTVFGVSAANLVMYVYPSVNAASYKITKTPT